MSVVQEDPFYHKLLSKALWLGVITISYNLVEGVISTFFGAHDETLALFGFGLDSFVEVISGVGIVHMIYRMKKYPVSKRDTFEKTALYVTGTVFYVLTAGLVIGAAISINAGDTPRSTLAGITISVLSIATMYLLYKEKLKTGIALKSDPVISDAKCTLTCFYLSFILLTSSTLYELFRIPYVDAVGSLGIAWYSFKEGREAFDKARSRSLTCEHYCQC